MNSYSTRATVVCGAGLLYRKWYNKNRYCAAGASYSNFVTGVDQVFIRYGGLLDYIGGYGYDGGGFSTRATVVCGAGLLYEKWYNKDRCCTAGASYSYFVNATSSVLCRVQGFLGYTGDGGYASGNISIRVSLVCGAGLLCKKWYNKNRYCTAGASNSWLVHAANPILIRYMNFFGSGAYNGNPNLGSGSRASVVCGAGLLYEKRYRKMQNVTTDNQFSGSHFSVHFF